ncbi:peptide-methionine (S)-S-oxide reductase MsrA [Pseudomaricurvus sp.]|uniref:peptide-methionine (S)-S-oxide reductase MsrA n=1 Tax=Pseudomaricurvus sp. TaxID=2004510 RepID=UPI003F6CD46B
MSFLSRKAVMVSEDQALPGRDEVMPLSNKHAVLGTPIQPPFPQHLQQAIFGLGCFWGAERKFWLLDGVYTTAVGYSGGFTQNPAYEEVCSGMTGHNEVVLVVYDPEKISYQQLLSVFWESHNPTQGMRQGNDMGTQYRSGIYTFDEEQASLATLSKVRYGESLEAAGIGEITTEILPAKPFYYAEEYHQQYLHKNPNGYCGLGGTGISCSL